MSINILQTSLTSHTLDSQSQEMDKPTKHSLSIPTMPSSTHGGEAWPPEARSAPERGGDVWGDGAAKSHMQVRDHELRKAAGCWMQNQQAVRVEVKPLNRRSSIVASFDASPGVPPCFVLCIGNCCCLDPIKNAHNLVEAR